MPISVDWGTGVISVPQSYLTFVSGTLYDMDTDQFWKDLKALEAAEIGIVFDDTQARAPSVTVAGVTYAPFVTIVNNYTVEFEDAQYAVRLVGTNNNIFDEGIIVRNQVSIIPTNSAGLQLVTAGAVVQTSDVTFLEVAYDGATSSLMMGTWLHRGATVITNPTSTTVDWYDEAGTLVFTQSSSSPDARGHFTLSRTQALSGNKAYYAVVSVTDPTGTVVSHRGVPTVGT